MERLIIEISDSNLAEKIISYLKKFKNVKIIKSEKSKISKVDKIFFKILKDDYRNSDKLTKKATEKFFDNL